MYSSIHFLRPWWFLALLPLAWLMWRLWQSQQKQSAWHQFIEPKFRPLLLGSQSQPQSNLQQKVQFFGLGFVWFFAVLALSGPWIKSVDVPVQKSQQGVVIVLDLSLSMLADDISPNRLARVKYTLTDLLKQNPEYAIGMVAYAGSAHTISPISEDNNTVLMLLNGLSPTIMPSYGSNPLLGLDQAHKLLQGAHITQGHIIWISDDIEANEVKLVDTWLDQHPYSMSLLTVGTQQGGVVQIPDYGLLKDNNDKLILPSVPLQRFAELANNSQINWQNHTVGKDNTQGLLPAKFSVANQNNLKQTKLEQTNNNQQHKQQSASHPLDIGFYFIFILIPLVALLFRRGVLLNLATLALVPSLFIQPQPVYASSLISDLGDVFKSHDQQGYEAWQAQEYEKAQQIFDNPLWRASAFYKQGKYAEAAKLFALDKSAKGYFNQGNALAHAGKLDAALDAYKQAITKDPSFTQAKDNLKLVKELKRLKNQQDDNSSSASEGSKNKNPPKSETDLEKNSEHGLNNQTQEENQASKADVNNGGEQQNSQSGENQSGQSNESGQSQDMTKQDSVNQGDNSTSTNDSNSENMQTNQSQSGSKAQSHTDLSNTENEAVKELSEAKESLENAQQQGSENIKHSEDNSKQNAQGLSNQKPLKETQLDNNQAKNGAKQGALTEEQQAQQNWLKQIPDQPGVFLKRKFDHQYQQSPPMENQNEKQW